MLLFCSTIVGVWLISLSRPFLSVVKRLETRASKRQQKSGTQRLQTSEFMCQKASARARFYPLRITNRTGSAGEAWLPSMKEGKYLSLLSPHVPPGWGRWQVPVARDIKVIFLQRLWFKLAPLPQRRPLADPPSSHLLAALTCCRYKRRSGRTAFEVPSLRRTRQTEGIKRKEKEAHASRLSRELNLWMQTRECPIPDAVFQRACTGVSAGPRWQENTPLPLKPCQMYLQPLSAMYRRKRGGSATVRARWKTKTPQDKASWRSRPKVLNQPLCRCQCESGKS